MIRTIHLTVDFGGIVHRVSRVERRVSTHVTMGGPSLHYVIDYRCDLDCGEIFNSHDVPSRDFQVVTCVRCIIAPE